MAREAAAPEPEGVPASVLARASEIIPGRFYFLSLRGHPQSDSRHFYWTVDHDLVYEPFMADFGPLNLSMLVKFCRATDRYLRDPDLAGRKIFLYSSHDGHKRANAGYLVAGFLVLVLGRSPEEAFAPIATSYPPFLPFRDALCGVSTYDCTIMHCLEGLHRAKQLGWVDWRSFDCAEYDHYEQPQNGDWNWVLPPSVDGTPGKFIAFSAPREDLEAEHLYGFKPLSAADYRHIFRGRGVSGVVRLCFRTYDRRSFTQYGFQHLDFARPSDGSEMYPDGCAPSDAILHQFLHFAETNPGAVAVHCKAGLGRTGTLIGAYLMKHHGFTARAAIAWLRICRPGSVLGPQQHYLVESEPRLRQTRRRRRAAAAAAAAAQSASLPPQPSPLKRMPGVVRHRPSLPSKRAGGVEVDARTQSLLARSREMQQEITALIELQGKPTAADRPAADAIETPRAAADAELLGAAEAVDCAVLQQLAAAAAPPPSLQRTLLTLLAVIGERDAGWDAARRALAAPDLKKQLLAVSSSSFILALPTPLLRRLAAYPSPKTLRADAAPVVRWLRAAAAVASRCPKVRSSTADSASAALGRKELSVVAARKSSLRSRLPRPQTGSVLFPADEAGTRLPPVARAATAGT
eukprot:TRINITY_DN47720_c0_g1_i1.p1 TRINITY_DN47720_c0_g1~~TRINITY_DN47720_c0_g1_i1.p1  ORF type:complete len:633 (+),score=182.53 TRINITY_DN47720_c0_g1_i1:86-1984(+)